MRKNNKIIVNCTSEEKSKIKIQAEKIGLPLQDYILKLCLNSEVEIKIVSR